VEIDQVGIMKKPENVAVKLFSSHKAGYTYFVNFEEALILNHVT
jgi:hypothetical protein